MQRRMIRMTVISVMIAVLLFAVPAAIFGSIMMWNTDQASLDIRAITIAQTLAKAPQGSGLKDEILLKTWLSDQEHPISSLTVRHSKGPALVVGSDAPSPRMVASAPVNGTSVLIVQRSALDTVYNIAKLNATILVGVVLVLAIGYALARNGARRISAPLIFLAAQAEQIASGQLRGGVHKSGIEEIDLVQAELQRTSERMAARIAAERQFSRDVSHQIRTPLTALVLRLEEIEYMTDDADVIDSARASIGQVDRLREIIDVLLSQAQQRRGGTAESLSILEIFSPLQEEWEDVFVRSGRELYFQDDSSGMVMATPAVLNQVLATLLENSLKYGAGITRVVARGGGSTTAFTVDVSDEGAGIPDDIAGQIFEKGFSGKGSSGLGLGIAKDLITSDGGSLELTRRRPPIFSIMLQAAPVSSDNESEAFVAVGRRHSRLN